MSKRKPAATRGPRPTIPGEGIMYRRRSFGDVRLVVSGDALNRMLNPWLDGRPNPWKRLIARPARFGPNRAARRAAARLAWLGLEVSDG